MTGLLVSVRSGEEAELALAGGADLVDVKEPLQGPLGAADPSVWSDVNRVVGRRTPTSAALGDLFDERLLAIARQTAGFTYAKVGLAGWSDQPQAAERWRAITHAMPTSVALVPVAYADWRAAHSLAPHEALPLAQALSARLLVIDTFDKSRGSLLDHLPLELLAGYSDDAARAGVRLVLAGSLREVDFPALLKLAPAYLGVRGAVCAGGRNGPLDRQRVKSLRQIVHAGALPQPLASA